MRIVLAVALAAAVGGCASATRGWHEQLTLTSTPSGAEAVITGTNPQIVCITPCVTQVPRNADLSVEFRKEGYDPEIVALTKEIATGGAVGFAGNVLLGGIIGMGVDAASGATLDHKPNPVIVTLRPVMRPAPPPPAIIRRQRERPMM